MNFSDAWIGCWNRRYVNSVLANFSDKLEFVGPAACNIVGCSALRNRKELEDFWRTDPEQICILEFKLDYATCDERRRELNVVYDTNLNGDYIRAWEIT